MAPSPEAKKKIKKAATRIPLVIFPLLLLIAILVYTKLYGFKHALIELVRSRTNGQYELSIKSTVVHFRALSFRFEDVRITRTRSGTGGSVRSVRIPAFDLQFGSLSSLFTEEFNIRKLEVEEPEIELESRGPSRRDENAMISQQIMELYPAIESVLTRFNIELLKINSASLELNQTSRETIKINFVDLLIEHWRMRNLSAQSQLKLTIEEQDLTLGNALMKFSGIEYNFLEHHLVFNDFHVSTADSISGSAIEVSGEKLLLKNLDYKDFYENLRYSLKRAEIDKPVIIATFRVKKSRHRDFDREVVTRMLKHTLGECAVDSAIIKEARIHLELQKDKDTIKIDLPDVDFKLHAFSVARDSSTFQIGEIEVNLNGSEITLSKTLSIKLDEVLFDRHRDLTLRNVTLYSPGARHPIATLSTLQVRYFNLMSLIFYSQFSARSIQAEGGILNIGSIKPGATRAARDTTYSLGNMFISSVILKDIDVNYVSGESNLSIEDMSVRATNVHYDENEEIEYNLKSIYAKRARVRQPGQRVQATAEQIAFNGRKINAGKVFIMKDSLTIHIRNLEANTRLSNPEDYHNWHMISVGDLDIDGKVPRGNSGVNGSTSPLHSLDEVMVHAIRAKLNDGKNDILFSGKNIHAKQISLAGNRPEINTLTGELTGVEYRNDKMITHASMVTIEYPSALSARNIDVVTGDVHFTTDKVNIITQKKHETFEIRRITGSKFQLGVQNEALVGSDSVIITGISMDDSRSPQVGSLEIFRPTIHMPSKKNDDKANKIDHKKVESLIPDRITLHPGLLTLNNGRTIRFGKITTDKDQGTFRCASLETAFVRSNLRAKGLLFTSGHLTMDSLMLTSNKKWYSKNQIEESQLDVAFQKLKISGFSMDELLNKHEANNLKVEMDHVELDVFRDKRLEDPPVKVKPSTLDGMIPMPSNVDVSEVIIHNGRIEYHHISDKTGEEGYVLLDNLTAKAEFDSLSSFISLKAKTNLYNTGTIDVDYQTLDASTFRLNVLVKDVDLTKLNQIVMPLQALRIKSGFLKEYNMNVQANEDQASGRASITYHGLHLEIFKRDAPEHKSLGSEMLTLLADGIILKHSKQNATADVNHLRVKHKSIFHYWVTSAVHGAMGAVRKGKRR